MTSTTDFLFENMSRIGSDPCTNTQQNLINVNHANYHLTNLFDQTCNMTNAINTSTKQPSVFLTGCSEVGPNGCNVDTNSELKIGTVHSNPKCRIMLHPRPFVTVPYLGKGSCNVDKETELQLGDGVRVKKSANHMSEVCLVDQDAYPMIQSVKKQVNDTSRRLESDADSSWIRGGTPSREAFKSAKYGQ